MGGQLGRALHFEKQSGLALEDCGRNGANKVQQEGQIPKKNETKTSPKKAHISERRKKRQR